ncbi:MAG: asparagine synthase (glutamine-hydrolyzing) [Planctomycetes bacterium]|nr:asparagine synthase (glutamine-hydrolyzing) [Planctomycetota bacterium]
MCGIAGILGDASAGRLEAMADSLRHRGPDDEGYWTSPRGDVGLAHRRLAIIDPEGGHQPVSNEDGRVITVFNGAIYNYRELREELESRGHRFRTQSDTETLVHLYEDEGADFTARLRGMFAIAIWDENEKKLLLARDRVGKKPLYYSESGGEFLFASEIKGIVAALSGRSDRSALELDEQALSDYLTWGCVPPPATIYRQIRSLKPGELLVVHDRHVVQRRIYWRQRMLPKTSLSRREAVEQVDAHLREAVRLRLQSDVPVGSFLSGGIDSGIVTAIAAQEYSGTLTTITVGFEDGAFDERPLARMVADRYATAHHEVLVRADVAADLPEIVQTHDQPFADASAIPSFYVAQAARRFVKVVLNGDGGDEVFAGYRRYVAARLSGLGLWSNAAAAPVWAFLSRMLPVPRNFRSPYAFAHRFVRGMAVDGANRYMAWAIDGMTEADKRWHAVGHGMTASEGWMHGVEPSDRIASAALGAFSTSGPLDQMLGTDLATELPFDLLVKMDIACMAHGLEARSPLLDQELIETVSRYPEAVKLSGFTTKPILRDLAARYVPDAVRKAPKRGFEVPLVRWLRGELRSLCEDVILSRDGLLTELFDRPALERLVRQGDGLDPARWSRRVWTLLMLGMWDRHVRRAR